MLNWGAPGGPGHQPHGPGVPAAPWLECSSLFFPEKTNTYPPKPHHHAASPPIFLDSFDKQGASAMSQASCFGAGNTGAECTANPQFPNPAYISEARLRVQALKLQGAQASLLSQPQPRSPGPTWTHSTPPPHSPSAGPPALGPGYLSGWLPTKRWQKSLLAGLLGFRAMKANWQSAGHQVA